MTPPPPLAPATAGVTHDTTLRKQARSTLLDMDIPEHDGRVFFHEVLKALAARACGPIDVPAAVPILSDLERQQNRIMKSVHKGATSHVHEHMAAELMQSAFRGHRSRRAVEANESSVKMAHDMHRNAVAPAGRAILASQSSGSQKPLLGAPAPKDNSSGETAVTQVDPSDDVGQAAGAALPRPPSSKLAKRTGSAEAVTQASEEVVTPIGVPLSRDLEDQA